MPQPVIQNLKPMLLLIVVGMFCLTGCDQHRYKPADWRAAPRASTTLPEDGQNPSRATSLGGITNWLNGSTLPGGSTMPFRGSTMPGRGWSTLPGRGWNTMPGRGWNTLPNRGWNTLPNRGGTTMPNRFPGQTTLPNRFPDFRQQRGTTLPEFKWSRLRSETTLPQNKYENPLRK